MKHQNKQHFSHHHILIPLEPDQGEQISCKVCEGQISEPFHGCLSCHFYLHDRCTDAPRSLDHPSHPAHPLTLLPTPTYPTRSFMCNACALHGKAYSFSCACCEFDLHVQCALMPSTILVENHPHELQLIFDSPCQDENTEFECNICKEIVHKDQWLFYCGACDFGGHLGCTTDLKGRPRKDSREGEEDEAGQEDEEAKDPRQESERRIFEAERKLREQRNAHMLMLQALDNAADYVGPSYSRKYYYY
ncbi:uncharacterized protein LOC105168571 [Sesamum indicum]|uniref:Uncharacterized protein LOC105168571 n=1 Tax=Sesamum indicum TaxID=4182 RepID=A0A6I9TN38_SESIN|nr:uncharacterized protein LOC105168571 [Sesamum indicum]